jgi:hypothetical protein
MSLEFRELSKRIKKAATLAEILRLERSADRLWVAGFMTVPEFARIDSMLLSRKISFE